MALLHQQSIIFNRYRFWELIMTALIVHANIALIIIHSYQHIVQNPKLQYFDLNIPDD